MLVQPEVDPRILVIGAGPAGLAAAVMAAATGLPVLLVDEAAVPGGQYLSGGTASGGDRVGAGRPRPCFQTNTERDGAALTSRVSDLSHGAALRLEVRRGATVWSLSSDPKRTVPNDTPLCRPEEVTAGQVRAAIAAGSRSSDALKPALRVGQGLCQGRTCGPVLARMLAIETGRSVEASGLFQARPPVKPVPLAAIAGPVGAGVVSQ